MGDIVIASTGTLEFIRRKAFNNLKHTWLQSGFAVSAGRTSVHVLNSKSQSATASLCDTRGRSARWRARWHWQHYQRESWRFRSWPVSVWDEEVRGLKCRCTAISKNSNSIVGNVSNHHPKWNYGNLSLRKRLWRSHVIKITMYVVQFVLVLLSCPEQ